MRRGRSWTQLGAVFMLGIACSFGLFPILMGPQIQRLRLERDQAFAEADALRTEILKLREAQQKQPDHPTVRRVRVMLDGSGERVLLEAERRIQKLLQEEVGRRIDDISSLLIMQKFQGKGSELQIDGVTYYLEIKVLVIGPEISLYGVLTSAKDAKEPKEPKEPNNP